MALKPVSLATSEAEAARRQEMRQKISAASIAATKGWRRFKRGIDSRTVYSVLTSDGSRPRPKSFPSLGYMLLLEEVLGTNNFRQACPWTLTADIMLAQLLYEPGMTAVLDDQWKLSRRLKDRYYRLQQKRAAANWPAGIGPELIDPVLEAVMPPALARSELWPFCRSCLRVQYRLEEIPAKNRSFNEAALHLTGQSREYSQVIGSFQRGNVINHCRTLLKEAFKAYEVRVCLGRCAQVFSAAASNSWPQVLRDLQAQIRDSHLARQRPTLNTRIDQVLSPSEANLMTNQSYVYLKDLEGVTREDLLSLTYLGQRSVDKLVTALRAATAADAATADRRPTTG